MSEISAELYKQLLDRMSDGVYFVDRNRRILYWNEGATQLTGYQADEVIGRSCQDNTVCHVDAVGRPVCLDGCLLSDCMGDGIPRDAELFLIHKQGRRVPVSIQVQPIRGASGSIVGAVEIFRDNTAQIEVRRKAEAMERLAFLDPLTQQPNRRFLEMSLRTALVEFEAHGDAFGVLLFDLNNFKAINDSFGHTSGDRALLEVARTLVGALRSKDVVGRWAGDEFLAIAHNVNMQVLGELAERCVMLVQAASFRNNEGGLEKLSISVGAALAKPGDDVEKLLAHADRRMYEKKKAGSAGKKSWRSGAEAAAP
jgi:diguanylate cyclase (GGDEF)-like protein/PAS domain S-box-containing protein